MSNNLKTCLQKWLDTKQPDKIRNRLRKQNPGVSTEEINKVILEDASQIVENSLASELAIVEETESGLTISPAPATAVAAAKDPDVLIFQNLKIPVYDSAEENVTQYYNKAVMEKLNQIEQRLLPQKKNNHLKKKKKRRRVSSEQFTKQQRQAYNLIHTQGLNLAQAAQKWQPKPCTWQNVQKLLREAERKEKMMRSKSVDDYLGKGKKRQLPHTVAGQSRSE